MHYKIGVDVSESSAARELHRQLQFSFDHVDYVHHTIFPLI